MRKSIATGIAATSDRSLQGDLWFDLERIAHVELSSEDPNYPFENALEADGMEPWKAEMPGLQHIKLSFDPPQSMKRIHLDFPEKEVERHQEIVLFACAGSDNHRKELVRQQWTFSPNGSTSETEDYYFDLKDVKSIELQIDPGRHDQQVIATLQSIRIG